MLYFNPDKFDFWKIYDCIKHFYPIGIKKDESEMYRSYPGMKELVNIIVDNIHDENIFNAQWVDFTKEIKTETGKEIADTTHAQIPSYSAFVLLEETSPGNLTRTKELHFFVSLLGPFYTIIAKDSNTVLIETRHYTTTSYLVVSPKNEFAEVFSLLGKKIEDRFQGFRFVPFWICIQTIDALEVNYSDENPNSVFNALFNPLFDTTITRTIGDEYYKNEDWIKEDYVDDGNRWTAYPLNYFFGNFLK